MKTKDVILYAKLMRVHKPIGFFLLLWPTLMAVWIAGKGCPDSQIVIVFSLGTFIMRSAGCVINDLLDHRFDKQVARTKDRPLVKNELSRKEAMGLFIVLILMALLLVTALNIQTILLSCIAASLAMLYPLMKRIMPIPQVVLGIAWAWSIPMAYMAILKTIPLDALILFCATVLWTIAFDTQYAMADRTDDIKIGVKSSAILFGNNDRIMIFFLQSTSLLLFGLLGSYLTFNFFFYGSVATAGLLFLFQHYLIRNRDPHHCFQAFLNNHYVGFVLFLGVLSQTTYGV